jgi:hypothetical protein
LSISRCTRSARSPASWSSATTRSRCPPAGWTCCCKAERGEVDPLDITADQYDLVCNGVELSSGAVRNHDPEIMIKAFELVRLGEEDVKSKFPAMYNAFCYGAPPHAGIAPGVDRMVMLLAGEEIHPRDHPVPDEQERQDLMMGAPGEVTQKQLDELHIRAGWGSTAPCSSSTRTTRRRCAPPSRAAAGSRAPKTAGTMSGSPARARCASSRPTTASCSPTCSTSISTSWPPTVRASGAGWTRAATCCRRS